MDEGYEAYVAFVVQMGGMKVFVPNASTDPEFATMLRHAEDHGVRVLCLECDVTPDTMTITGGIPHRMV